MECECSSTAHPDLLPTWVANRGHRRWVFIALYDGHEFCGEYKGTVHRSPRVNLLERTQRHGLDMVARIGSEAPKRCHSRLTCRTCGGTCPRSRRKSGSRQREPECCSAWSHCPCTGTRGQACILKANSTTTTARHVRQACDDQSSESYGERLRN